MKKEIEKLTKQVENASASTSSTSSGDSCGRKRKATDPPEDFGQDKKVRNLQKQLLESKKNVKLFKTLFENLKHTYGISPFTGKLNRNIGGNFFILVTNFSMSPTSIYHFRTNSNENKILLFGESRRGG